MALGPVCAACPWYRLRAGTVSPNVMPENATPENAMRHVMPENATPENATRQRARVVLELPLRGAIGIGAADGTPAAPRKPRTAGSRVLLKRS